MAWKNRTVSPVAFLAVAADAICHSTPKISAQHLQKWTAVSVFSLNRHCSVSFLSARLLNPVRFFAHYFILRLPSDSPEWKLSSHLLPDEYGARLTRYAPGCSLPPTNVQQPYVASDCREPLEQGETSKALKRIWILSPLSVLPLVCTLLGAGICLGLVCRETHPERAIPII